MTANVVSGLKKKRDELSKQLHHLRTEMHKTIAAIDSVDCTIRAFVPDTEFNRNVEKLVSHSAQTGEERLSLIS